MSGAGDVEAMLRTAARLQALIGFHREELEALKAKQARLYQTKAAVEKAVDGAEVYIERVDGCATRVKKEDARVMVLRDIEAFAPSDKVEKTQQLIDAYSRDLAAVPAWIRNVTASL